MNTVNVVVVNGGVVDFLMSFAETKQGNVEAENLFRKKVKKFDPNVSDEDMEDFLENGYFEGMNYSVNIVHSFPEDPDDFVK